MQHTLESQKLFPIVAWALVISFALFVGHLALKLNEISTHLMSYEYSAEM